MNDIEKRARELLAAKYEERGHPEDAESLRSDDKQWWDVELAVSAIIAELSAAPQVPEGWVLVPRDCVGAVRVARIAMLEKEAAADSQDELMDAAMWADAAADLKKIIDAVKPEPQA